MSVHDELLTLCREMYAAGELINYAALRTRRGGGSRRDIARALQVWRQQNTDGPAAASGRPSQAEVNFRDILERQQATITDQQHEIRILMEEIRSLERMVREYRGYPGDFEELS